MNGDPASVIATAIVVLGLYFAPVFVSILRKTGNAVAVAVVCFFFGWTVIGWIIALIMALGRKSSTTVVNVQQFAGPVYPQSLRDPSQQLPGFQTKTLP